MVGEVILTAVMAQGLECSPLKAGGHGFDPDRVIPKTL